MSRRRSTSIYIGIKHSVLALDRATGAELWRTRLQARWSSGYFVTVALDGDCVLATFGGEVFCLDAATGSMKWKNNLKGLGAGLVTLATERTSGGSAVAFAEHLRRQAAAASGAS